ncbi:hypothetical protein RBH94_08525 [Aestuariibaculum sp. YM273]|uniref:hypothetical protein n=1 Tax=Aestuariibaculum sp. YM273 TaxID=3070659 RepID=UPI0027DDC5D4|nr:hypothetical protein [Aestuariibaculum sp. YM273]WMI64115.1 hypothetical protein RBH94_08525 [Aestuariibaculum sp. YM273]
MIKMKYFVLLMFLVIVQGVSFAQIITKELHFDSDKANLVIEDVFKGEEIIDYALNVKKGDSVNIILNRKINSSYFNLLPPGSDNVADFIGQTQGDTCKMVLPQTGVYKIRVYQMRSSARRGTEVKFKLDVSLFESKVSNPEKE